MRGMFDYGEYVGSAHLNTGYSRFGEIITESEHTAAENRVLFLAVTPISSIWNFFTKYFFAKISPKIEAKIQNTEWIIESKGILSVIFPV